MANIIITHTHQDGTTLDGSAKGDGILEIVRQHGFTWRPAPGIHIRGSRDKNAKTWRINSAAEALRAAGHTVTVTIDDTPRPTAVVEAERVDRAEHRADRYAERADKHAAAGDARLNAARRITDGIPFGQPIQPPGHHSHKPHVNALNRADGHRSKAVGHWRTAEQLADRVSGVVANQAHRENPRTTMRRVEKLESDARRIQRDLDGYERNFRNNKGEIYQVERHEPATGERRETKLAELAHVNEQLTYWRGQLAGKADSGEFVSWGREHFQPGDWVNVDGRWCEVARVNAKSVTVRARYDWDTSDRTDRVAWDGISGRRRDGMQWDTPNGQPWPVELAKKIARWKALETSAGRNGGTDDEDILRKVRVRQAKRIAFGLDVQAVDAEVLAFLDAVTDDAALRQAKAAFVDIYDRLAAGEPLADVLAGVTPLDVQPVWRMPDRQPQDCIAARSPLARVEYPALQPGDLLVGMYDGGRGERLMRDYCGPVVAVSAINDRRERGEFVTITLAGGREIVARTYYWFSAHPAGTWESPTEEVAADEQPPPVDPDGETGEEPTPDATPDGGDVWELFVDMATT